MSVWKHPSLVMPPDGQVVLVTHEHSEYYGKFKADVTKMKQRTVRKTATAYWTGRQWNLSGSDNDGHGDHGLAYPVVAWRTMPKPSRA